MENIKFNTIRRTIKRTGAHRIAVRT